MQTVKIVLLVGQSAKKKKKEEEEEEKRLKKKTNPDNLCFQLGLFSLYSRTRAELVRRHSELLVTDHLNFIWTEFETLDRLSSFRRCL